MQLWTKCMHFPGSSIAMASCKFFFFILFRIIFCCRDTVLGTYTSVCLSMWPHSWSACATDLLTSNVHVAAPYCARQLKTDARQAKTAKEVRLQGIHKKDRLRSAKNVDYTS